MANVLVTNAVLRKAEEENAQLRAVVKELLALVLAVQGDPAMTDHVARVMKRAKALAEGR